MTATVGGQTALGDNAARQLANATKTVPQLSTITPRWLTHLLQWVPVEAGIYRLNQVKNPEAVAGGVHRSAKMRACCRGHSSTTTSSRASTS